MGPTTARSELERGNINQRFVYTTAQWLAGKEREIEARKEASILEQIALMQRASEAAERASEAAERQATAAERANTRATIALVIAIMSMIVTMGAIFVNHLDIAK
jgi:hypothetical protein